MVLSAAGGGSIAASNSKDCDKAPAIEMQRGLLKHGAQ